MKWISHGCFGLIGFFIGGWYFSSICGQMVASNTLRTPAAVCPKASEAPSSTKIQSELKRDVQTNGNASSHEARVGRIADEFWDEFNRGEITKARVLIEEIGRLAPNSLEYHEGLTRILVRTRDYEAARPALKVCLERFPNSKSCLLDRADVELQIGDGESQLESVNGCLSHWPDYPPCLNDLAIINMHRGHYDAAVTIYERLPALNGKYGFRIGEDLLHWQLGHALEGAGRLSEAQREFDAACRSNFSEACSKADELKSRL